MEVLRYEDLTNDEKGRMAFFCMGWLRGLSPVEYANAEEAILSHLADARRKKAEAEQKVKA